VTDLAPAPDERDAGRTPLGLSIVLGLALLPLGKLVPVAVTAPLALAAAMLAGGLAMSSPLLAGAIVAVPLTIAITAIGLADSLGTGALALGAGLCVIGLSALAGAAGAMLAQGWADGHSDDPEARARARRGVIILVLAALFFGGPRAAQVVSDERADDRAEALERRLVAVTKASVPFDGFVFANDPANPISREVPEVHLIATGDGANMQAEASWGLSTRCVLVQVNGTAVTSRIVKDPCGPLVGR